jgi:hypothetical protein
LSPSNKLWKVSPVKLPTLDAIKLHTIAATVTVYKLGSGVHRVLGGTKTENTNGQAYVVTYSTTTGHSRRESLVCPSARTRVRAYGNRVRSCVCDPRRGPFTKGEASLGGGTRSFVFQERDGTGAKLLVAVKDSKGQPGERLRYLEQLGKIDVVYAPTLIPKGDAMTSKAVRVAMSLQKHLLKGDAWQKWIKDPRNVSREWLVAHGVKVSDVQPPTLTESGKLRVVLWVSAATEEKFYKACGQDAVLT